MINLKKALTDPGSVFKNPQDVLLNTDLTREDKIKILQHWESDLRVILVAEEENMQGKDVIDVYNWVLDALRTLDAVIDTEHRPPTKQAG